MTQKKTLHGTSSLDPVVRAQSHCYLCALIPKRWPFKLI